MRNALITCGLLLMLGIIPGCIGLPVEHCDWRSDWRGGCLTDGGYDGSDGGNGDGGGGGSAGTS